MDTLIAEDLLLLLLDEEKGRAGMFDHVAQVLPAAVLAELSLAGAVEIHDRGVLRSDHVRVVDGADGDTVTDPVLRDALTTTAEKPRSPQSLMRVLGKDLEDRLCQRLADRGVLRREEGSVLGIFPRTSWPEVDNSREDGVRRELAAVLLEDQEPSPRAGVIVALLLATRNLDRTLELPGRSRREVKKRAEEVADGGWASAAVKQALDSAMAVGAMAAMGGAVAGGS